VDPKFKPVAVVNRALAEIASCSTREVTLSLSENHALKRDNEVILTCDPFAVMKVNVRWN